MFYFPPFIGLVDRLVKALTGHSLIQGTVYRKIQGAPSGIDRPIAGRPADGLRAIKT